MKLNSDTNGPGIANHKGASDVPAAGNPGEPTKKQAFGKSIRPSTHPWSGPEEKGNRPKAPAIGEVEYHPP